MQTTLLYINIIIQIDIITPKCQLNLRSDQLRTFYMKYCRIYPVL